MSGTLWERMNFPILNMIENIYWRLLELDFFCFVFFVKEKNEEKKHSTYQ